jgi:DNA-binding response OmpR family regulator
VIGLRMFSVGSNGNIWTGSGHLGQHVRATSRKSDSDTPDDDQGQMAKASLGCGANRPDRPDENGPQIDWASGIVSSSGRQFQLSRVETRLMSALFAGKGAPVSRAELYAHVWPDSGIAFVDRDRRLFAYISDLRRRFAAIGLCGVILTARRRGYRLAWPY